MNKTGQNILDAVILVLLTSAALWFMARAYRRSEERRLLLVKWISTFLVMTFMVRKVLPMAAEGGFAAIGALFLSCFCGLCLAITWRQSLASLIAKPFGSLYDGGDREIDPQPVYSTAQAKRKRGDYAEAVAEIRRQLERFPNDYEGQLMLAEIQAENMNDLPGAEVTVHRLCAQPGHAPRNIAFALNTLADWHLKINQDRDAAREDLEQIIARMPDTELAALAAQRIGHLAETAFLLAARERKTIALPTGVENVGLLAAGQQPKAPVVDVVKLVQETVRHLEKHPLDTEARERLAVLYADHYGRLDMAVDQLEQLIAEPHQPGRRVVHWLNLLADLQVRHNAGYENACQTLQRIIERFPNTGPAQLAMNRLALLKLELKGKEKNQAVPLGAYEQDIGLKQGRKGS
jgi:outer membrane protein assembly factor BamD (BamD/ComL family)